MIRRAAIILCIVVASNLADAQMIAKTYRWDSSVDAGTSFLLTPTRGETMVLQPRVLLYGQPMDLTHAYTVFMIYKAVGETSTYSISGSVLNPTNGQVQIEWTSANELPAATYAYDVLVSGPTSTVVAARGAIKFRDGVATGAQLSINTPIYILDFDQVQLLNVGNAPFLSSYEINDIRDYLTEIQNGLADIDCRNITIRGTLNYTNWPEYLARTNDIPAQVSVAAGANITVATTTNAGRIIYTVTGAAGGGSGGGGIGSYTNTSINGQANSNHVYIVDGQNTTWLRNTNGLWSVNVQIPPETEPSWASFSNSVLTMASQGATAYGWGNHASAGYLTSIPDNWVTTGTNAWVINGQTVGYVTANGIRLLTGTLTLDNYDLDCNVRLYDGSRVAPSLTPRGHPNTWGLYFKGYNGSYSAAWSQNLTEIGILSGLGITLMTTNAAFTGRHVGDAASLTINGQNLDLRYALAATNAAGFAITNVFAGITNRLWFSAQGACSKLP